MKFKRLFILGFVLSAFLLSSCSLIRNLFGGRETPKLYPIIQRESGSREKFGYINSKGEIVIQPQYAEAWFFSEGLAVACIERGKCGYIDETGKFIINPQFQFAGRFSEGLAAVNVEGKLGYVDKTGKLVINPQFQSRGDEFLLSIFSQGLAGVTIGDKFGYVDETGKIVINPQFNGGLPFMENLAAVKIGEKWGYIDKEGKIIINPQFEMAHPFVNGLAAAKIGNQWGYVDKTGSIAINPQFDFAAPFADEGAALVFLKDKAGYINKEGKYIVNPQYSVPQIGGRGDFDKFVLLALAFTSDLGRISFSEGFALANVGDSSMAETSFGYADSAGKMVINPQFKLAFPFFGELALVMFDREEFGYVNKDGKIVWRQSKETAKSSSNTNMTNNTATVMNSNTAVVVNSNSMNKMSNSSSSQDFSSQEYEGTINNNYEITMTLTRSGNSLTGYVVPKSGGSSSILVRGTIDGSDEFNLSEYDDQDNWTGTYKGRILSGGRIEGSWTKPDGSAQRPLSLREK